MPDDVKVIATAEVRMQYPGKYSAYYERVQVMAHYGEPNTQAVLLRTTVHRDGATPAQSVYKVEVWTPAAGWQIVHRIAGEDDSWDMPMPSDRNDERRERAVTEMEEELTRIALEVTR